MHPALQALLGIFGGMWLVLVVVGFVAIGRADGVELPKNWSGWIQHLNDNLPAHVWYSARHPILLVKVCLRLPDVRDTPP